MATLMESMLRMHQFGLGGGVGGEGVEEEEGAVEMVEERLEEDIEEGQEHIRMAQEQEDVRGNELCIEVVWLDDRFYLARTLRYFFLGFILDCYALQLT